MKREMITLLLKCAWAVWRGNMMPMLIRHTINTVEISLYKRRYYEEMFKIKEVSNGKGLS